MWKQMSDDPHLCVPVEQDKCVWPLGGCLTGHSCGRAAGSSTHPFICPGVSYRDKNNSLLEQKKQLCLRNFYSIVWQ